MLSLYTHDCTPNPIITQADDTTLQELGWFETMRGRAAGVKWNIMAEFRRTKQRVHLPLTHTEKQWKVS